MSEVNKKVQDGVDDYLEEEDSHRIEQKYELSLHS